MELGFVGKEVTSWNGADSVISFELANDEFYAGSVVVERQRFSGCNSRWVTMT